MNTRSKTLTRLVATGVSLFALSSVAMAAPAVGLVGDKTLVWFDTDAPEVSNTVDVEGVDSLVGIDVRPGDGKLYGVAGDGTIVTIDLETGAATAGGKLTEMLPDGVAGMVDFNPVADAIRVMGTDGTNLRIKPDTGETTVDGSLNFEAGDANADATPNVVATAYINSIGKPEATAMYDIDAGLGALLRQTAPNDGTLATIGELGIEGAETYAFDIQATAEGENTAWLAAAGALYTVDLETGAATKVADITGVDGDLRDIAILPAM
jgi:hypothetical protein